MNKQEQEARPRTPVDSPSGWRSKRKLRKKSSRRSIGSPITIQRSHRDQLTASPSSSERSEKVSADSYSPCGVTEIEGILQQPIRKHVRFQPYDITGRPSDTFIANDLVPASSMSMQDKRRIWWQSSDYQIFKQTGRLIAQEIQRRQDGNQSSNPNSYSRILDRTYGACHRSDLRNDESPLTSRDKRALQQWSEIGICRRGLEKWSLPDITMDRFKRKAVVIQTVLCLQGRLRASRSRLNFPGREGGEELMRVASERLTKPARLFARAMGEVDELSVDWH